MPTFWFCVVALMIAAYATLDGLDLGAGIIHLIAARTGTERRQVIRSIGPIWDGNEVWLLAAGGTLYFAFPRLYASSFSGFYLPLIMVLWLLMLRGIAVEFRNHVESPVWEPLWDVVFSGASALLAFFFGAALGNVIRGVPLDASGFFFEPLWTDPGAAPETGILDAFTLLTGLAAFLALAVHGALWVVLKSSGDLRERARRIALLGWWGVAALTIAVSLATFRVQPLVALGFESRPWLWLFPLAAVSGLIAMRSFARRGAELAAFLSSCLYIAGMLSSAAAGLYPIVLPSHIDPSLSLTIQNAAAPEYGLRVGLAWFLPGMALVTGYFVFAYRQHGGKVSGEGTGH
jgi:cytochrome d ubiquinol oxidase subunit II